VCTVVSATGVARAQETALAHLESGDLVFSLAQTYLGGPLTTVMMILLLVSLFAAMLAFHNSASRYLYSLGRAGVLPHGLARTHTSGAPQYAGVWQAGFAAGVALVFAIAGASPISTLVPAMLGFGPLSIIVLQALAALSIVVHFRRQSDRRWWSTFIAPGIGLLGLAAIVVLAVANFDIVAGSSALVIQLMPLLLVLALVGGIAYGAYLKNNRPRTYQALAEDLERFNVHNDAHDPAPER